MKTTTEKVLKMLISQELERSKYWPEKTSLLIDAAEDLGFDELSHEMVKETF